MPRLALEDLTGGLDLKEPLQYKEIAIVRTFREHVVPLEELEELRTLDSGAQLAIGMG